MKNANINVKNRNAVKIWINNNWRTVLPITFQHLIQYPLH